MRRLDRYILGEFLQLFLYGVVVFSSLFIGGDVLFRMAGFMTDYGASLGAVAKMFVLSLPRIIVYTFPMSVLLAALMTIVRLSGSSELIVMRAAGQSFARLVAPIIGAALVISLVNIVFNEYVVPAANTAYEQTLNEEIKGNMRPQQVQNHIVLKNISQDDIRFLLYANRYDPTTETLRHITIQEFQHNELVRVENAPEALWRDGKWYMKNGTVYDLAGAEGVQRMLHFEEQVLPFTDTPTEISKHVKTPDQMTIRELRHEMQAYRAAYADTSKLEVEMHRRFSLPLASLVFAVLGTPLGVQRQRSSSSVGFGLCILVIFMYYALMMVTGTLGEGGVLPPMLAVWIPNLAALAAGIGLQWRVN